MASLTGRVIKLKGRVMRRLCQGLALPPVSRGTLKYQLTSRGFAFCIYKVARIRSSHRGSVVNESDEEP